ncbi:MAG: hypothetical protein ABIN01_22570 [Ferruginibacter sp.]
MEIIVTLVFIAVAVYLGCGVIFSFFFIRKGMKAIDPDGTHGSSAGFKIIIIPGVITFWWLLLKKWRKATPSPNGGKATAA